jgi:protein-tyrosine phosphatase
MIDLHAHVLPGVDDGPASVAEALELLRDLVAEGVEAVAVTPHVRDDYPTTAEQIAAGLDVLRSAAAGERLDIEILPGAEVALDRVRFSVRDGSLTAFSLAGNPRYLLVECPYYGWPADLSDVLRALLHEGVIPVLAHPERNPEVQRDSGRIASLVDDGVLVQVTASSLASGGGTRARRTALHLLELGLVHLAGSDAHGAGSRRVGLSTVRRAVADDALGDWLTTGVRPPRRAAAAPRRAPAPRPPRVTFRTSLNRVSRRRRPPRDPVRCLEAGPSSLSSWPCG